MSSRNVKILAAVVLVLFGVLFALNSTDRTDSRPGEQMLFPEIKSRLNDLNAVTITDAEGTITLQREATGDPAAGRWVSSGHDGYPADTGKLRQLLLAIADARKIEQKTADPELYERLGVSDPRQDGGDGVLVTARGSDLEVSVILGDTAQGDFRYARLPEEDQSWLIDQNPNLPGDSNGWLLPQIVDIGAARVRSVVLRHADGEEVRIRKADADAVNYEVEDIPEGRELRYPSVANGIAGVLGDLTLQDVRKGAVTGDGATVAEFTTFDGLKLLVRVDSRSVESDGGDEAAEEEHWISVEASAGDAAAGPAEADASEEPEAEPSGEAQTVDGEAAESEAADPNGPDAGEDNRNPAEEAVTINDRVSGWSYRIADYKADQLTRRLADLLSEEDADAE